MGSGYRDGREAAREQKHEREAKERATVRRVTEEHCVSVRVTVSVSRPPGRAGRQQEVLVVEAVLV